MLPIYPVDANFWGRWFETNRSGWRKFARVNLNLEASNPGLAMNILAEGSLELNTSKMYY